MENKNPKVTLSTAKDLLLSDEVAEILRIDVQTVRRMTQLGLLHSITLIGRKKRLYPRESLIEFLNSRRQAIGK